MEDFTPGQRWISNTESELGLGLILEATPQRVTVLFLASGQKRTYARDNAPLTRVSFGVGDIIESIDEELLTIVRLDRKDGLITYVGKNKSGRELEIDEMELSHHIKFNKPQDRLFTGQTDPPAWFLLRRQTWRHRQKLRQSAAAGLLGGRTSLIPHQLYISHEAANRIAPRIMLADEVGLGKTIEAGLILHYRLFNGLSKRALIIVPETLLHQWLVEMLRRFNLRFSIIDAERCRRFDEFDDDEPGSIESDDNPFLHEQLVLSSQEFFQRHPQRQLQALDAGWDIAIVDEAHHLQWSETSPSAGYRFVEQLSRAVPSIILLTATPEQMGRESHFATLRLLDSDRFHSLAAFLEEQKHYEPAAAAARLLASGQAPSPELRQELGRLLKDDKAEALLHHLDDPAKAPAARAELINLLLDQHGTGRILFRNSRQTVGGFPDREYYGYRLPAADDAEASALESDPRFGWLVDKIRELAGKKALLICKRAQTAVELEHALKNRAGIASALFHEGLSIIERDRAAAYFADEESSARLLICSEIGSEGRNFQFVHHLILFDLPDNPDLLQQRIGRLDRIGQQHVIRIHVPYRQNSDDHVLYRWYDEGLDVFRKNNPAAQKVAERLQAKLARALAHPAAAAELDALIAEARTLTADIAEQLHKGRDLLLELNSCRRDEAAQLMQELTAADGDPELWPYLENLLDCYGVDSEYCSEDCHIVRPGDHMRLSHFPGLPEDGFTFTVNRQTALAREDLQFLTWEHPFMTAAMEEVVTGHAGNAAISVVRHPRLQGGRFLLECLFIIECSAPPVLQVSRFLPPTPIFVLVDQNRQDLTGSVAHESLPDAGVGFDKNRITAFLNNQRSVLTQLLAFAEQQAKVRMQTLVGDAAKTMLAALTAEIRRLVRLQKINPGIRNDEIEQMKNRVLSTHEHILAAQLKLDAVRFIITH